MEAARQAADRGHEVILFEKNAHLGGTLNIASLLPFKSDMKDYLDWAVRTTMKTPGLSVRLSTEATPELVKAEKPDKLIIAVGAEPLFPSVSGIDRDDVIRAGDVFSGMKETGDSVVVAGAGLTGSETALHLAQQGKKVTIFDMLTVEEIFAGAPYISIIALWASLQELGVEIKTEMELDTIEGKAVITHDKNHQKIRLPCDTVVLALGLRPRADIIDKFKSLADEVITIGDCNNQRGNLYRAVTEGFFAAMDN